MITIDAQGMEFAALNRQVREAVAAGARRVKIINVNGQRYIGCGLKADIKIEVEGVAGADMAAFMDGPEIRVSGSAEAAIANTMNAGKVVIQGNVGDVAGYAMRGGKMFIRGDAGYRVGIHMKSFQDKIPVIVVGGVAQDFLGEYMAGGILIVLGLNQEGTRPIVGRFVGTGLHGGAIYVRGDVTREQVSRELTPQEAGPEDMKLLKRVLKEYCQDMGLKLDEVMSRPFVKLAADSHRPYQRLYAY